MAPVVLSTVIAMFLVPLVTPEHVPDNNIVVIHLDDAARGIDNHYPSQQDANKNTSFFIREDRTVRRVRSRHRVGLSTSTKRLRRTGGDRRFNATG